MYWYGAGGDMGEPPVIEPDAECACAISGAGGAFAVMGEPSRMADELVRECIAGFGLLGATIVRSGVVMATPVMAVGESDADRGVCFDCRFLRESCRTPNTCDGHVLASAYQERP